MGVSGRRSIRSGRHLGGIGRGCDHDGATGCGGGHAARLWSLSGRAVAVRGAVVVTVLVLVHTADVCCSCDSARARAIRVATAVVVTARIVAVACVALTIRVF